MGRMGAQIYIFAVTSSTHQGKKPINYDFKPRQRLYYAGYKRLDQA